MKDQFRLLPVAAFIAAFGVAFGGAYGLRSNNVTSAVDTVLVTTVVETTVTETTIALQIDETTSAPPAETPTTIAETDPPPTAPPTTDAPPERPLPRISTDGANLQPLGGSERQQYSSDEGCRSLSRTGTDAQCGFVSPEDSAIAWVIEPDGAGVDILTRDVGTDVVFSVALRSLTSPSRQPRLVDATGDGVSDLVFGWRDGGGSLGVDIVELRDGSAAVTLHLALVDGRLTVGDGQIDAWSGVRNPGESTSSSWDHNVYTKSDGRWTVTSVRDDSPPGGEFA